MTRNHRKAGVIRVVCTDAFHHDQAGYAELSHHHIGTLRLAQQPGTGDAGFRWHGPQESATVIETHAAQVSMSLPAMTKLPLPVKMWRDEDDRFIWRFRCAGPLGCGRDAQRHDSHLAQIVIRWAELKPDTPRVTLDITRL